MRPGLFEGRGGSTWEEDEDGSVDVAQAWTGMWGAVAGLQRAGCWEGKALGSLRQVR